MDTHNNSINNNFDADHESSTTTTTTTTMSTLNESSTHPLQDVPLTMHENMSEMQTQQHQQKVQNKENWVKFDDEVKTNEVSSSTENNNNNINNNIQNSYDQADSSAITTTPANKLLSTSPTALLPPPPKAASRPRTPNESGNKTTAQIALQREPVTTSPLNAPPTPVERLIVSSSTTTATTSPDVAPAVLTTESTHVNLNASGKALQHQQHQQHQYQQNLSSPQQHQQQQQKSKTTSFTGSGSGNFNQQQQQPIQAHHTQLSATQHHNNTSSIGANKSNHNNNGTTTSIPIPIPAAATTPTTTSTKSMATTNNAMHHKSHNQHSNAATTASPVEAATSSSTVASTGPPAMRTIELSTGRIREGFANGDVIVTLLPANTKWPWITPAIFRPELVPEELMAQGLTLTVEEYVQAMETLVNDYRFTVYNICYKRILVCWILFAFTVLLTLLFSGLQGVALFSLGVCWLFLNAAAIFLCMWVKLRLARGLEKCLARVNRQLIKHKILLILDDRGRISCHKVNLCFLYFDSTECVNFLNEFLEHTEQNGGEAIKAGWESKLDIDLNDIVIQGSTPVRLSRKQDWGLQMFLRYSSRWGMEALRGLVDITPMEPGRHCGQFRCPCQYIKQHLQCKPRVSLNSIGLVVWTRYPTSLK